MSLALNLFENNYVQGIPREIPLKMAQSFIATTTICLIYDAVVPIALLGGMIAATATVIEALTRPIIESLFAEAPFIGKCIQVAMPPLLTLQFFSLLSPWIGIEYRQTNFLLPWISWYVLNERYQERNLAMAVII